MPVRGGINFRTCSDDHSRRTSPTASGVPTLGTATEQEREQERERERELEHEQERELEHEREREHEQEREQEREREQEQEREQEREREREQEPMKLTLAEALSITTAQILCPDPSWERVKKLLEQISGEAFNANDLLNTARVWRDCRAWITTLHPDLDVTRSEVLKEAVAKLRERIAQLTTAGISGKTPGDSKHFVVEVWLASLIPTLGDEFEVAVPITKVKNTTTPKTRRK